MIIPWKTHMFSEELLRENNRTKELNSEKIAFMFVWLLSNQK
jgi:hypothetical protein